MAKKKAEPFHLRKQLELAYNQGFYDGYMDACDIWEVVASHTPGIGQVLQDRMLKMAKQMATERALKKIREKGRTK